MTFYKLTLVEDGTDLYVSPNSIMAYCYENDDKDGNVVIYLNGGDYVTVSNSDFLNMMFMEGGREY